MKMLVEPLQVSLHVEIGFEDHGILIAKVVNRRDGALREGIVQRVVDVLYRNAVFGRFEPVDREHDLRAAGLAVRVDIHDARNVLHAVLDFRKPLDDILEIRAPYGHLILRPRLPRAELKLRAWEHA